MRKVPEIVYTTVRKIEPVGDDLVRMYCSIEYNGEWEDRGTLLVPIKSVLRNAEFITQAAAEIFGERLRGVGMLDVMQVH